MENIVQMKYIWYHVIQLYPRLSLHLDTDPGREFDPRGFDSVPSSDLLFSRLHTAYYVFTPLKNELGILQEIHGAQKFHLIPDSSQNGGGFIKTIN